MRRSVCFGIAVLFLVLLCSCTPTPVAWGAAQPTTPPGATAALTAQLGILSDLISPTEYARALVFMEELTPLRQARLEGGRYEKSTREEYLVERLNLLYERYTQKYLEDAGTWGYTNPRSQILEEYDLTNGALAQNATSDRPQDGILWEEMTALLPQGAFADFTRFIVFTDGLDETLAYVTAVDSDGENWEIAIDPADAEDGDWFRDTVLHEYCHYLTLNSSQARYGNDQTTATYNEDGMQSQPGSYLDDFYQAFWVLLLDDRLANMDSYHFLLRHEDQFVTAYASSDPSEDIAESFTYFVVWDRPTGEAIWEQKLNFFYDYPELVDFRTQVRKQLGWNP